MKRFIILIGTAMIILVVVCAGLALTLMKTEDIPEELPEEPIFSRYGNFKSHDNLVRIITNTHPEYTTEEIEEEVLSYYIELLAYGDYEDAYTYVNGELLAAYDYAYDFEDYLADCHDLFKYGEEFTYTRLSPSTPYDISNNMGIREKVTIRISYGDKAVYRTMVVTEDYRLVPFDCTEVPSYVRYGVLSEGDGQLQGDTYTEELP